MLQLLRLRHGVTFRTPLAICRRRLSASWLRLNFSGRAFGMSDLRMLRRKRAK
jgi:hypothetical protein